MQPKFNLAWRHEYEAALQDLCVAREIPVLPYGLASAFLSGKFRKPKDLEGTTRGGGAREFADNDALPVRDKV